MRDAPLREGLLLLAGLGLLSWPLALVTGESKAPPGAVVGVQTEEGTWVTDVQIKAVHPFEWIELRRGEEILGRVSGPAQEGEFECELAEHGEVLTVAALFAEEIPETALQMRIWPASLPEKEFTFWVEGELLEEVELRFHE